MVKLVAPFALLTLALANSPECTSDQCTKPTGTQANTLLQISKDGALGKAGERVVVESEEYEADETADKKQKLNLRKGAGAQWTEDEALAVMAKIRYTMENTGIIAEGELFQDYECMQGPNLSMPCNMSENKYCHVDICMVDNKPDLDNLFAKYVRLGFHTCFKYEDGSGGCNGCMWFGDMFGKFTQLHGYANQLHGYTLRSYENREDAGKNNGLSGPADILEKIYTDKDFPADVWPMEVSLKDSGKSRADLWAFAGLVAAEFAADTNNKRCKGEGDIQPECEHNYAHTPQDFPCELTVDKPPTFWTGRSDCPDEDKPTDPATSSAIPHRYRDYETIRQEVQPSANMNGTQVADFMKDAFGFSYKETVAIMGAHSIGGFKFWHSMRKYRWQRGNAHLLNNNYYRIMMGKPAMFLNCGNKPVPATAAGAPGGGLARTGWWVRPLRELKSGGPYLWFHYFHRCPTCYKDRRGAWVSTEQRGTQKFMSEECCACNEQTEEEVDEECYMEVTQDETAINTDLGLYYDFQVGESGIPLNCPGIPSDTWSESILADTSLDDKTPLTGGVNCWDTEPKCGRNNAKEEGDDKSLSDYVEQYADNQNLWANDFFAAYEKMLSNGYAADELREGPQVLGIGQVTYEYTKKRGLGWAWGCTKGAPPPPDASGGKGRL